MQNLLANNHPASLLELVDKKTQQSHCSATLYNGTQAGKAELEAFVSHLFQKHYGAQLAHFYPHLLGVRDSHGDLYGVAGYRRADEQRLFLEQYLDAPVEQVLASLDGVPVTRGQIVEIGNLAADRRGACRDIFKLLSLYFHSSDIRWVVFTGTPLVSAVVKRLHLKALTLVEASESQLDDGSGNWGSYYQQRPQVMAMPVQQSIDPISSRFHLQIEVAA